MKGILKSSGAILAGFVAVAALSVVTDVALVKADLFPPIGSRPFAAWMLALALAYRTIYTVAGGYLTARFAPNRPLRHAVILGIIGLVAATAGSIANWDKSAAWYPLALIAISLPACWLGGWMREKKL